MEIVAETKKGAIKYVPNALSILRIALALVIGVLTIFYQTENGQDAIYWIISVFLMICITTDILDGLIARKFKITSKVGANLDIVGDVLTIGVMVLFVFFRLRLMDNLQAHRLPVFIIIAGLFGYRIFTAVITKFKFGKFSVMHTYANKAAGGAIVLCAVIFILWLQPIVWLLYVTFAFLFLAFTEEMFLIFHDKYHNVNRKGFLFDKARTSDSALAEKSDGDGRENCVE